MDTNYIFYDEHGTLLNYEWTEREEQLIVEQIIHEDCIVLELGARYGTVSCRINRRLKNRSNQVSVEPDPTIWDTLEKNRSLNNCEFYVLKGAVSSSPLNFIKSNNPYASSTEKVIDGSVNCITVKELEKCCNLKFNTLVADCEGFLEQFFEENPHMYEQLYLIFFEKDYPDVCDYNKITNNLKKHGFTCIIPGFHEVWINYNKI